MKNISIKTLFLSLPLAFLAVCVSSTDTFAWSSSTCANWFNVNTNSPQAYASFADTEQASYSCYSDSSSSSPHGAMFITGQPVTSGKTLYVNSVVTADGDEEQTFYLTGGFYSRGSSSKRYVYGGDVNITTYNGSSYGQTGIVSASLDWNSTMGNYVYRGYLDGNTDTWVLGSSYTVKVNRDNFYSDSYPGLVDAGNGLVYRRVGIHRCWWESDYYLSGLRTSGSCDTNDVILYGKKKPVATTFTGSAKAYAWNGSSWLGNTTSSNPVYVDAATNPVYFTQDLKRNNDGPDGKVKTSYSVTRSGTRNIGSDLGEKNANLSKNGSITQRRDPSSGYHDAALSTGLNTLCQQINYYSKVEDGTKLGWTNAKACAYVYRYSWYNFTGSVTPAVSGGSSLKNSGNTYYTDSDDAELKFTNTVTRVNGSENTQYKTNAPSGFRKQTNYTNTSGATTTYVTPASGTKTVSAPNNDTGTEYCDSVTFYSQVREGRGTSTGSSVLKGEKTETGCITLKRYKTTFSGATKVYVNGTDKTDATSSTNPLIITNSGVPTKVTIKFTHTITRDNNDAPPASPNSKKSHFTTNLSGTVGYRSSSSASDPHGTVINKDTKNLAKGQSDTATDEFDTWIYPDQTITFCQQLNYTSVIRGATGKESADATKKCVTIKMGQANCSGDNYGIHDGRNSGSLSISKVGRDRNGGNVSDSKASGKKDTGTSTVTVWAKPGDSIRYEYSTCAAADLSNQFNYFNKPTTYNVSTPNGAGYLFGKDFGNDKLSETSINFGVTKTDAGKGPFSGDAYIKNLKSPSDSADGMYFCNGTDYFSTNIGAKASNDYYQITGSMNNSSSLNSGNCKSYSYTKQNNTFGTGSNAGKTIRQSLTFTDLWISSDTVNRSHNGSGNVVINGDVKVPYNYTLKPYVSLSSTDTAVPYGSSFDYQVYVPVMKKTNTAVETNAYATHTKPTKIQVFKAVIRGNGLPLTGSTSLASNTDDTTITDLCNSIKGTGTIVNGTCSRINPSSDYSKFILNGDPSTMASGTGGKTNSILDKVAATDDPDIGVDTGNGSAFGGSSIEINNTYNVGDKICVAVAAWPADSHNGSTDANQTNALTSGGGTGASWAISAPACITVAKRPTFSVEGGDLVTTGPVKSTVNKINSTSYTSWAEYGIYAGGKVSNTASGAGSAYLAAQAPYIGFQSSNLAPAQHQYNTTDGAGYPSGVTSALASQTITNVNLNDQGRAFGSTEIANQIKRVVDSLKDVYTRKGTGNPAAGTADFATLSSVVDLNGVTHAANKTVSGKTYSDVFPRTSYGCVYDEDAGYFKPNSRDSQRATDKDGKKTAPYYCLSNGSRYYHSSQNGVISGQDSRYIWSERTNFVDDFADGQETYSNGTSVYHIDGDLVIDTNWIIDSYDYDRPDSYAKDYFQDIQTLPATIFIAKNVYLTSDVTRLDAIIIADNVFNTCAYTDWDGFVAGNYINSPKSDTGTILNAEMCERELIVNGAVFANRAYLNRIAGSGTKIPSYTNRGYYTTFDAGSFSQRAEIFNLRPDIYMWAYYQAQRNGILTTVYSKEMPTRY